MAARSILFDSRYSWRDLYKAAALEPDNKRLPNSSVSPKNQSDSA